MSLKDFEIGKELGKGAFGTVSLVKRIEDGKTYAMKRVKISQLGTKEKENALNEVRILASLSHPNIIGYREAFFDEDSRTLNIVMEFADDGDIESKIQKNAKTRGSFPETQIWTWLIQTLQGLKYLHDNKIMHRDLKCANIFLMKNGLLKLGDLNVSKIAKMGMAYTQTGTPYYASPEVWADKPYDYKSDIWSVGCIIYEICTLRPPFRGNSLEQLMTNVRKGIYDQIPTTIYSKDLSKVISLMLVVNPSGRPTCEQLLSNELIVKRMNDPQGISSDLSGQNAQATLIKTIKLPRNMNEINRALPKQKRYKPQMEEMLEQDEYETKKAFMKNKNSSDDNNVVISSSNSSGKPKEEIVMNSKKENIKADNNSNSNSNSNNNNGNNNNNNNNNNPKNIYHNIMNNAAGNNNRDFINEYLQKEKEIKKEYNPVLCKNNAILQNNNNNNNHYNQQYSNNPPYNVNINNAHLIINQKSKEKEKDKEKEKELLLDVKAQQKNNPVIVSSNAKDNIPVNIYPNKIINRNLIIVPSQNENSKNINARQVIQNNNNNNPVVISKDKDPKPKPVSNRPQSAKPQGRDYNNLDNQIKRRGVSDRANSPNLASKKKPDHVSPLRVLNNMNPNQVVISGNAQINRPQSGRDKDKIIASINHDNKNNRRIVYQRINYQPSNQNRNYHQVGQAKIMDGKPKPNFHYNQGVIPIGGKNNMRMEENIIQRGMVMNPNNGPKIVYHKK